MEQAKLAAIGGEILRVCRELGISIGESVHKRVFAAKLGAIDPRFGLDKLDQGYAFLAHIGKIENNNLSIKLISY
jgi:hypothetical protein